MWIFWLKGMISDTQNAAPKLRKYSARVVLESINSCWNHMQVFQVWTLQIFLLRCLIRNIYMTFTLMNFVKLLYATTAILDRVDFINVIKDASSIFLICAWRFYWNVGSHEAEYHLKHEVLRNRITHIDDKRAEISILKISFAN